ncbi:glutaredoxin 3 [Varunaivibrio sulfuroxidans]|uniref:Glutaredoxin n=1 Tax=Varunaivibrio sulfuroxidans TaxID=1773489 RepID=A0A4R3JJM9_9PROT|nr:glutaredoxin 3 [Varunaivibrio sulfuroxidans]TCS65090.1 glutaredoxin 3 [Varunaivibrio sulfuroxidans]WES29624.1 glutaredoxin 3 [Varunaivibrio sulfuroxidans]
MSVEVEIYTTPICPYCARAKALLDKKGVSYTEIDVMRDRARRREMEERSNGHTVPQIFIAGKAIGGCDDMFDLDFDGELDKMLGLK